MKITKLVFFFSFFFSSLMAIKMDLNSCDFDALQRLEMSFENCVSVKGGPEEINCKSGARAWQEKSEFFIEGVTFTTQIKAELLVRKDAFWPFVASCLGGVQLKSSTTTGIFQNFFSHLTPIISGRYAISGTYFAYEVGLNDGTSINVIVFTIPDPFDNSGGIRAYIYAGTNVETSIFTNFSANFEIAYYIKQAFGNFIKDESYIKVDTTSYLTSFPPAEVLCISAAWKALQLCLRVSRNLRNNLQGPSVVVELKPTDGSITVPHKYDGIVNSLNPYSVCLFHLAYLKISRQSALSQPYPGFDCTNAVYLNSFNNNLNSIAVVLPDLVQNNII